MRKGRVAQEYIKPKVSSNPAIIIMSMPVRETIEATKHQHHQREKKEIYKKKRKGRN